MDSVVNTFRANVLSLLMPQEQVIVFAVTFSRELL
jgi:hypothetical protein